MKFRDLIKISQANLLRSKLRTVLTVGAVFVGALTISLTNGVGNGVRDYTNRQLGNLGAENILLVQAPQPQQNPVNTEVKVYEPDRQVGEFNMTFLGSDDIARLRGIGDVLRTVPVYLPRIEYVTRGGQKYQATASQYVEGFRIEMAAGRTITPGETTTITLPIRYIEPLGLGSAEAAIGQEVIVAYKDVRGQLVRQLLMIVGIQENSLIGNADMSISEQFAASIHNAQTAGVANLAEQYIGVFAEHDPGLSEEGVEALKQRIKDAGYSAQTLEDRVGMVAKVIDTVVMVLNIFGGITLLAAGFGIINTLLMSVKERTSEIGLMKALGADRRAIFSMFAMEAVSLGFWGGLLGTGASIAIGAVVNRIAARTFLEDFVGFELLAFPSLAIMGIMVGVMLLALAAGVLPALKASKLDPIQALRYE